MENDGIWAGMPVEARRQRAIDRAAAAAAAAAEQRESKRRRVCAAKTMAAIDAMRARDAALLQILLKPIN